MKTDSDARTLQVSKEEWRIISAAVEGWLGAGIISAEEAQKLRNSCAGEGPASADEGPASASEGPASADEEPASAGEGPASGRKTVARYSFAIASFCVFLSVALLLTDEGLIALFAKLFNAPALATSIGLAIVAGGLFWQGARVRIRSPDKTYAIGTIFFWGAFLTALSIGYLGRVLEESDYFYLELLVPALLMFAAIGYGVLALWLRSDIIWLFSLLSLGHWFAYETDRVSSLEGWFGMNLPLRFVLFGAVITLCGAYLFSRWKSRSELLSPTMAVGLLFFFLALYATSICGNYPGYECDELTPIQVFHWWIILALASVAAIFHGVKYNDDMTKGFGLAFIFINLYTRFFELFWEPMHKAVFFAILAASFWYLGAKTEKIWRLSMVGDWLGKSAGKQ